MHKEVPVIAIDGPSGSGKGTIAEALANRLGFHLLDSGALYRLSALAASTSGIAVDNEVAVVQRARSMDVRFEPVAGEGIRTWLDGTDVTSAIRNEETAALASKVAALPGLRKALLGIQRDFRREPGLVADGRDMGTVVFPDAVVKIFLTASAEVRARRRFQQLKDKGIDVSLESLIQEIAERDARDSSRAVSPLRRADDAIAIDSSQISIEEVNQQVMTIVGQKLPGMV